MCSPEGNRGPWLGRSTAPRPVLESIIQLMPYSLGRYTQGRSHGASSRGLGDALSFRSLVRNLFRTAAVGPRTSRRHVFVSRLARGAPLRCDKEGYSAAGFTSWVYEPGVRNGFEVGANWIEALQARGYQARFWLVGTGQGVGHREDNEKF